MPVVPMEEDTLWLTTLVTVGAAVVTMVNKSLASWEADEVVVTVLEGEVVCGVTGVAGVVDVMLGVVDVMLGVVVTAEGEGLGMDVTCWVLVVPLV